MTAQTLAAPSVTLAWWVSLEPSNRIRLMASTDPLRQRGLGTLETLALAEQAQADLVAKLRRNPAVLAVFPSSSPLIFSVVVTMTSTPDQQTATDLVLDAGHQVI